MTGLFCLVHFCFETTAWWDVRGEGLIWQNFRWLSLIPLWAAVYACETVLTWRCRSRHWHTDNSPGSVLICCPWGCAPSPAHSYSNAPGLMLICLSIVKSGVIVDCLLQCHNYGIITSFWPHFLVFSHLIAFCWLVSFGWEWKKQRRKSIFAPTLN